MPSVAAVQIDLLVAEFRRMDLVFEVARRGSWGFVWREGSGFAVVFGRKVLAQTGLVLAGMVIVVVAASQTVVVPEGSCRWTG